MFKLSGESMPQNGPWTDVYFQIDEVEDENGLIDDHVVVIDLLAEVERLDKCFRELDRPCLPTPAPGHEALTRYFSER